MIELEHLFTIFTWVIIKVHKLLVLLNMVCYLYLLIFLCISLTFTYAYLTVYTCMSERLKASKLSCFKHIRTFQMLCKRNYRQKLKRKTKNWPPFRLSSRLSEFSQRRKECRNSSTLYQSWRSKFKTTVTDVVIWSSWWKNYSLGFMFLRLCRYYN